MADEHGLEVGSPRETVRSSLEIGLLDGNDAEKALIFLKDRNLVVHAYAEALAEEVHRRVPEHAAVLTRWFGALTRA